MNTTTADDWVHITSGPLSVQACSDFVTAQRTGGINIFLGTTRAESNSENRKLVALDYEAYTEMATQQLKALAQQARQQWPIIKLAMLHRIGRVSVGGPSVIIAVSTPHRAEAFEAGRWLIDRLKKDVAIWKKEIWADGTGTWVHP